MSAGASLLPPPASAAVSSETAWFCKPRQAVFAHLTPRFITQQGAAPLQSAAPTPLQLLRLLFCLFPLQGGGLYPVRDGHRSAHVSWSHSEGGAPPDLQAHG